MLAIHAVNITKHSYVHRIQTVPDNETRGTLPPFDFPKVEQVHVH